MSFFPTTDISFADSEAIDAYARLRVSNPTTEFESKLLGDKNPLVWDDALLGVGALATYEVDRSTLVMSVPVSTISSVVRQSKTRSNFHPGKSHEVLLSFCMDGTTAGVTKEAGYNDAENGILLQFLGDTVQLTRRTNVTGAAVDVRVLQAAWSQDHFDGTGPSGATINWSLAQTMFIDFEWPTGRIRAGFVIDGKFWVGHKFLAANVLDRPSFGVPNLPIRYRIDAPTALLQPATMQVMASSVSTEGGSDEGLSTGITRTGYATAANTAFGPLMVLSQADGAGFINLVPKNLSLACDTSAKFEWKLLLNPTFANPQPTLGALTNWITTADIALTNASAVTVGTTLASGVVDTSASEIDLSWVKAPTGQAGDGAADVICLAISAIAGAAITIHASFNWTEVR
tara:strand:+ start:7819 stop:9024 length:1206 start_codon:yes stop_codon:yes gene_type:complete